MWKSFTRRVAIVALVMLLAAVVLLPGCRKAEDPWGNVKGGPPRVLVSFAPLYCFAKAVAGDEVAVLSLTTTIGPHDHSADADDAIAAQKADLFLANGLTLDDFVTKVANQAGNPKKDLVHKLGEAIPKSKLIRVAEEKDGDKHDHDDKDAHGHKHAHGEFDPHVWLGVEEAEVMVNRIADLLAQRDPARKDGYKARAAAYVEKLHQLLADGKKALKGKKNRKFITNHHSFRYFARSFGVEVLDSIQMQAGNEPTADQMVKLTSLCKKHDIRVIGVEPQYSKAAAETLQKELRKDIPDLVIVELDPIETADPDQLTPEYYLKRMKQNVENLAEHLK
jgi:ABC-type Zn uptake system ZnuABC Zn-binding protein ZnuA